MGCPAREADPMTRKGDIDESTCPMVLLPPEMKNQIISYIIDDQTTASALRTLEIFCRWGGQIDAVERLSQWGRQRSDKDEVMYETSTALHFAVFLGNVRLTETLLDMKASLTIPCSAPLWELMGTEELLLRVSYFQSILEYYLSSYHCAFPIFLAFLQSDPEMCKLLVDHGAGREATINNNVFLTGFAKTSMSPAPKISQCTPLHVALFNGCTQGMQIALETGAAKESKNSDSRTPLYVCALGMKDFKESIKKADSRTIEEHMRCFRKFVELGGSVNPE
ncbi:uncharacterized protein CPUR_03071 [Claviceps purpurea 20.1]|uniref:Uncharacterized protein n=1 Tax=Claviceps purpurea (strain 20.1) TaxID=1111077 RepID=M1W8N2_CLAP2|nr:uncharacterized protein CPUR_03071 [Claviceps purpurea 20.1]